MALTEFLDHFDAGSLNARWTARTSGSGSVSVSDSMANLAQGGTADADCAAIVLAEPLDFTKDWMFRTLIKFTGSAVGADPANLVSIWSDSGVPSLSPSATVSSRRRIWVDNQASTSVANNRWQHRFKNPSGTLYNWRGSNKDWSTSFQHSHTKANEDNFISVTVYHKVGSGLRVVCHGVDPESATDTTGGFRLGSDTDWVEFGTGSTNIDELDEGESGYLVIGDPSNDSGGYTHVVSLEMASMYEVLNTRQEMAFTAGFKTGGWVYPYEIREMIAPTGAINAGVPLYIPSQAHPNDSIVVAKGSNQWVQDPYVFEHTDGTQYMVHNRRASNLGHLVIRSRASLGAGWSGGTDIISYNTSGLHANTDTVRFPQLFYYDGKWRLFFSVEKNTPFGAIVYYAESSNADPTVSGSWGGITELFAAAGDAGWGNDGFAQPFVRRYDDGAWRMILCGYNSAIGSSGQWQTGFATASAVDGTWTLAAGVPQLPVQAYKTQINGAAVSERVFNVDDSSGLAAGMGVVIGQKTSDNVSFRPTTIRKVISATQIEVMHRIEVADNHYIATYEHASSAARSLRIAPEGGRWELWVTAFRFRNGEESVVRYVSAGLGDPATEAWTADRGLAAIPVPMCGLVGADFASEENIGHIWTAEDLEPAPAGVVDSVAAQVVGAPLLRMGSLMQQ